jgi:hypothetical protein
MEYCNRILLRYSPHYSPDQLNLLCSYKNLLVLYEKFQSLLWYPISGLM